MEPYRVEIGDLSYDLAAQIEIDDDIAIPDIHSGDTVFVFTEPAHIEVALTNAGDGFVLHGSIRADLCTECVRCLDSFNMFVRATVDGLFTTAEKATELPDDQEWFPISRDAIDIAPALESAIRLELPFAPIHSEDCAGICPSCGCNRNTDDCSCSADQPDAGPFEALRVLVEDPTADE